MDYYEKIKDVKNGMDPNDVKIGMKVMPFKKTVTGFDFKSIFAYLTSPYKSIPATRLLKNGYLVVEKEIEYFNKRVFSLEGDYFTADDFIPYNFDVKNKQYLLF